MNIASYIDHTLLRPDCVIDNILQLCTEALEYGFAAVCVPPYYVKYAKQALADSSTRVRVATVIGFPMGYSATPSKVEEIKRAIDDGADEIDAVVNLCAIKSRNWNYVHNDIDSMTTAVHLKGRQIKIIIETGLLVPEEIEKLSQILLNVRPDFVKTSTGFNGKGAELSKVQLLQELLEQKIRIKASGGIRSLAEATQFSEAGAKRIGTSSGLKIMQEMLDSSSNPS